QLLRARARSDRCPGRGDAVSGVDAPGPRLPRRVSPPRDPGADELRISARARCIAGNGLLAFRYRHSVNRLEGASVYQLMAVRPRRAAVGVTIRGVVSVVAL